MFIKCDTDVMLIQTSRVLQVRAMARGRSDRAKLLDLMNKKEVVGDVFNQLRLAMLRRSHSRPAQVFFKFLLIGAVLYPYNIHVVFQDHISS